MICKETWPGSGNSNLQKETKKIVKSHRIKEDEYRFEKIKIFICNSTTVSNHELCVLADVMNT